MSLCAQHFAISSDQLVEGMLTINVEMAAFASSETRPGRSSEAAVCVQEQVCCSFAGEESGILPTFGVSSLLANDRWLACAASDAVPGSRLLFTCSIVLSHSDQDCAEEHRSCGFERTCH